MPVSNGKIYIDTTVTPNLGVGTDDVGRCLGLSSRDVGTLCASERINKWARYKPERANGPLPLSHGTVNSGTRSRRANLFGLEVPFCNSNPSKGWYSDLMNGMVYAIWERTFAAWSYLKPRGDRTGQGGGVEAYRLSDFVRIPGDTTVPAYASTCKGYNHKAPVPIRAFMSMAGVTINDYGDYYVYEINKQATTKLVLTFVNCDGDDLQLQDFIDLNDNTGSGDSDIAWRPVLQIFKNDKIANANNNHDELDWWNRSHPDYEVAGEPITSDTNAQWQVEFDISGFTPNFAVRYHLCIGIGCCKKNPSAANAWKRGYDDLFILPYAEELNYEGIELPFYYQFAVVSHFDRNLQFTSMMWGGSNTANFSGYSVPVPANASGTVVFAMTIKKSETQALHFVAQHGTPSPGYDSLEIYLEDTITHTKYYLTPRAGLNYTAKNDAYVPTGSSGTVALYGWAEQIDVNSMSNGSYWRFQVKASINGVPADDANAISIHKLSTT